MGDTVSEWRPTSLDDVLILFDLDGTLTDPFVGIAEGVRHAFTKMGRPEPDHDDMRRLIGPPFQQTFPTFGMHDHEVDEAIAHYRDVYEGGGLFKAYVYEGIDHVLGNLRSLGHTLALATSKPTGSAERVLGHFGLADHFSFVGGASRDRSRHQKHEVIAHVLEELGATHDQIVMVGDRVYDVEGARHCGVPCVGVRWGYAEPGELEEAGAVAIAEQPADLHALLDSAANS